MIAVNVAFAFDGDDHVVVDINKVAVAIMTVMFTKKTMLILFANSSLNCGLHLFSPPSCAPFGSILFFVRLLFVGMPSACLHFWFL